MLGTMNRSLSRLSANVELLLLWSFLLSCQLHWVLCVAGWEGGWSGDGVRGEEGDWSEERFDLHVW